MTRFTKEQDVSVLNKVRLWEEYNVQIQKRKEMGLDEAVQDETVHRSEKDTWRSKGTETVYTTVSKNSVGPRCIPNIEEF